MDNELILNEQNSFEILNEIILYMKKILLRIDDVKLLFDDLEKNKIWVCDNADYFKSKCIYNLDDMKKECILTNQIISQLLNNISNLKDVDKNVIKSLNGELEL